MKAKKNKIIGIIAEYNPFHLGHLYQIKKIKEIYPDSIIVVVISTYFTERGEISILNKWDKTKLALTYGIDLVLELPTIYATQSADIFASKALEILNDIGIDTLVFGSECNDTTLLSKLANTQINDQKYDELVKTYLDNGLNYPTAMSKALYTITNYKIDKPNDLLALSYIKEIIKNKYPITPLSIKRTNDYHGKTANSKIINASLVREYLNNSQDISPYVPKETLKYINKVTLNDTYNYLKYIINLNKETLNKYLDVDEGIEGRIIKSLATSPTWDSLVKNIKTKRYTYNKINRMLIHIFLDIKKEDNQNTNYLRVLGFTEAGKTYLNKRKKELKLQFIKRYKKNLNKVLDIELTIASIYALIINDDTIIKKEYQNKPIIY